MLPDSSKGVPMQKLPSPSHYARAAIFLASDDADMITGLDLRIDAGAISRYWLWDPGAPARIFSPSTDDGSKMCLVRPGYATKSESAR